MTLNLTDTEKQWAQDIKQALINEDEALAKTISDLELAQHAIIAKEKIPTALKRIKRLQAFKEEHGICDAATVDDAMETIQKFEALSPGMFLGFGQDEQGRNVTVWNYSAFLPANYHSPEDWKTCFAAFYYLFEAMQPDIPAIRQGMVMVADAQDMGWRNFSFEMEKHAAHLYQDAYPMRIKEMTVVNSPALLTVMYELCKPFLSKKVKETFGMNGTVADIQARFPAEVLPANMGGTQSVMDMEKQMREGLQKRFDSKAKFTL